MIKRLANRARRKIDRRVFIEKKTRAFFKKLFRNHKMVSVVVLVIFGLLLFIPFPYEFEEKSAISMGVKYESSPVLELGTSEVVRGGADGEKITKYRAYHSFYGMFVPDSSKAGKKQVSVRTIKAATPQTVVNGTKKYQFMWCSDGTERYFTIEQFKNPKTGFTSKSDDFCQKNGQGAKIQLSEQSRAQRPAAIGSVQASPYIPPNCIKIPIPYKTTYKNEIALRQGETSELGGRDGYRIECTADSTGYKPMEYTIDPIDKIIYVGTKIDATPEPAGPLYTHDEALQRARNRCLVINPASSANEVCIYYQMRDMGYDYTMSR